MHDFKKVKREEVIMARRTEIFLKKKGSMSRCCAKMRDSMAARSFPPSGSIRTKGELGGQRDQTRYAHGFFS